MLVRDIMTETVAVIGVDTTIHEAAVVMRDFGVGFLPVVHEDVCAGVLTDRDIVLRVVAEDLDPHDTTAAMVLTTGLTKVVDRDAGGNAVIASISEDATADEALQMMDHLEVNRLAVHDEDFAMVGVISRRDIQRPAFAEVEQLVQKVRNMPRGDKSKYTDKQMRTAEHIEEGYKERGVSEDEAESRAWATVNATDGGGKKSGAGRGKARNPAPSQKGGKKGGAAAARRPAAARSASAKKAAATRKRRAARSS